jgi:hypothetical protein
MGSTLEADEAELAAASLNTTAPSASTIDGSVSSAAVSPRRLAALRYRVERKQLLQACQTLLTAYCREGAGVA